MSCFCRHEAAKLEQLLAQWRGCDHTPPAAPAPDRDGQLARDVRRAAEALAARALPDDAWQPDPTWLDRAGDIAVPRMDSGALATLSGLATLASEARALGLDPRAAPQPFHRAVATLRQRLSGVTVEHIPDPAPWQALARQAEDAGRVAEAARRGLLDPSPDQAAAYGQPANRPMQVWAPLLRRVKAIAPLLATLTALGETLDDPPTLPQRLAAAIRPLRTLRPPAVAPPAVLGRLLAVLSAMERLRATLGGDPAAADVATLRNDVRQRTRAAAALLGPNPKPEVLPYCPSAIAPASVVVAASTSAAQALAAIDWKVPPAHELPALTEALPAVAVLRHVGAVLRQGVPRSAPCAGCDAAALTRQWPAS